MHMHGKIPTRRQRKCTLAITTHGASRCMSMLYSICSMKAPRCRRSLQQQTLSHCNNSTDIPHALASESPEETFHHAMDSSKQYAPLSIDVTPVFTLQSGSKSERSSYSNCPAHCNVCCSASCILRRWQTQLCTARPLWTLMHDKLHASSAILQEECPCKLVCIFG